MHSYLCGISHGGAQVKWGFAQPFLEPHTPLSYIKG
jgi:hypothetical protein